MKDDTFIDLATDMKLRSKLKDVFYSPDQRMFFILVELKMILIFPPLITRIKNIL